MITIILEDGSSREIDRISEPSNAKYLIQGNNSKYRYISQISEVAYDAFSSEEMSGLIQDLLLLSKKLNKPEYLEHVSSIIRLAERCQKMKGAVLVFTPWGDE